MGMNVNGISALPTTKPEIVLKAGANVGDVDETSLFGGEDVDTVEISPKPDDDPPSEPQGTTGFGRWLRGLGNKIGNFFKGIWNFFFKKDEAEGQSNGKMYYT